MELSQTYFASISLFHIIFIKIPTKKFMISKLLGDISPFIIKTYYTRDACALVGKITKMSPNIIYFIGIQCQYIGIGR